MSTSNLFREHIDELERRAADGDWFAEKSLACMVLLKEGWRYGDPDPDDTPPDDGGEVINLSDYKRKLAA